MCLNQPLSESFRLRLEAPDCSVPLVNLYIYFYIIYIYISICMLGYINIIYIYIRYIILYKYFQANAVSTVLIHFYIIF